MDWLSLLDVAHRDLLSKNTSQEMLVDDPTEKGQTIAPY